MACDPYVSIYHTSKYYYCCSLSKSVLVTLVADVRWAQLFAHGHTVLSMIVWSVEGLTPSKLMISATQQTVQIRGCRRGLHRCRCASQVAQTHRYSCEVTGCRRNRSEIYPRCSAFFCDIAPPVCSETST